MGATESVFDDADADAEQPRQIASDVMRSSRSSNRSNSISNNNNNNNNARVIIAAKKKKISPKRQRRDPSQTKPIKLIQGVVLGCPKTGKNTLLRRLEGVDPFVSNGGTSNTPMEHEQDDSNNSTESKGPSVMIPYKPPSNSSTWDRIKLRVQYATNLDVIQNKVDFVVVMVNPKTSRHDIKSHLNDVITSYLKLLNRRPSANKSSKDVEEASDRSSSASSSSSKSDDGLTSSTTICSSRIEPFCMAVLVNFRDLQVDDDDNKDDVTPSLVAHLKIHIRETLLSKNIIPKENNNVVLDLFETSLLNYYGLDRFHHFIYRTYLQRSRADLEDQLCVIQNKIEVVANLADTDKSIQYNDFIKEITPKKGIIDSKRSTTDFTTTGRSSRDSPDDNNSFRSMQLPLSQQQGQGLNLSSRFGQAALEAFLASSSDEEDEKSPTNNDDPKPLMNDFRSTSSSNNNKNDDDDDDDDDDFFYDDDGNQQVLEKKMPRNVEAENEREVTQQSNIDQGYKLQHVTSREENKRASAHVVRDYNEETNEKNNYSSQKTEASTKEKAFDNEAKDSHDEITPSFSKDKSFDQTGQQMNGEEVGVSDHINTDVFDDDDNVDNHNDKTEQADSRKDTVTENIVDDDDTDNDDHNQDGIVINNNENDVDREKSGIVKYDTMDKTEQQIEEEVYSGAEETANTNDADNIDDQDDDGDYDVVDDSKPPLHDGIRDGGFDSSSSNTNVEEVVDNNGKDLIINSKPSEKMSSENNDQDSNNDNNSIDSNKASRENSDSNFIISSGFVEENVDEDNSDDDDDDFIITSTHDVIQPTPIDPGERRIGKNVVTRKDSAISYQPNNDNTETSQHQDGKTSLQPPISEPDSVATTGNGISAAALAAITAAQKEGEAMLQQQTRSVAANDMFQVQEKKGKKSKKKKKKDEKEGAKKKKKKKKIK